MTSDAKAMCETFNAAFKLGVEKGKEVGRREAMSEMQETITALAKSQDKISTLIDQLQLTIEYGGDNAGE
jgi:flagellar biosynthesis/type III secretory pathway protein FliH